MFNVPSLVFWTRVLSVTSLAVDLSNLAPKHMQAGNCLLIILQLPLSKSELRNTSASVCLFSLRKIDQSVPSNMKRVNMVDMFSYPDSYQPPEDAHLAANSHYPNLNSREYLNLDVDESLKIQKYHDIFEVNQLGNVVLGCNDYTARIWSGSFWGFDRIANYGSEDASYKLRCKSNVTNVKYVEDNMILVSEASGTVELWSTAAEVRSKSSYCLFNVGRQCEHIGVVLTMDIVRQDRTKALTGSSDATIKLWDMGAGDLCSQRTYRYAHADAVTAVSSSPSSPDLFVSCGRDRCYNLWDNRLTKPVVEYSDHHSFAYTSIYWSSNDEGGERLMIGDETGCIHVVDPRQPKVSERIIEAFETPIHRIRFQRNLFVVLAQSNKLLVFDVEQDFQAVYENKMALDCVRDVQWTGDKEFHTVGWDSILRKHTL